MYIYKALVTLCAVADETVIVAACLGVLVRRIAGRYVNDLLGWLFYD